MSNSESENINVQLHDEESDVIYEFILSSEDAKKCETDLGFATSLINSRKSSECVNDLNYLPSCNGTSNPSGDLMSGLESDTEDCIQSWTEAPTKLLFELYNNLCAKVGKTFKLKSKKKMWEVIKIEIEKHKYNFSVTQIENRWKTLERAFKKKTETAKKTGEGRVRCLYEKELAECSVKNVSVFPEFTLGAQGEGKETSTLIKDSGIDLKEPDKNRSSPSTVSSNKRAKIDEQQTPIIKEKPTAQAKGIAAELRNLRMLKEAHYNEKLLAYQERTAQIKRKHDLLEKLIQSLEK